jgi:hypothetical protein
MIRCHRQVGDMEAASRSDADILDLFEVVVDETADRADFEDVLADFLLHVAEKRRAARANMEESR